MKDSGMAEIVGGVLAVISVLCFGLSPVIGLITTVGTIIAVVLLIADRG